MTQSIQARDKASKSQRFEFEDEPFTAGAEGAVYFTTDGRQNVVKLYTSSAGKDTRDLQKIIAACPDPRRPEAAFFGWPWALIDGEGGLARGIVMPNVMKDRWLEPLEWFESVKRRQQFGKLRPDHTGDFRGLVMAAFCIAQSFRFLVGTGFGHGDISGNNVLINPVEGIAVVIDLDGLVVPDSIKGNVYGTHPYIAPEIVENMGTPKAIFPSPRTDRHALAVILHTMLLMHHPLKGSRLPLTNDPEADDQLQLGKHALFVEDPGNPANRIKGDFLSVKVLGPEMERLFHDAFDANAGLHNADKRPHPGHWEEALTHMLQNLTPCTNPNCWWKFFPDVNERCPLCDSETAQKPAYFRVLDRAGQSSFYPYRTTQVKQIRHNGQITRRDLFGSSVPQAEQVILKVEQRGSDWIITLVDSNQLRLRVIRPNSGKIEELKASETRALPNGSRLRISNDKQDKMIDFNVKNIWTRKP